jgi:hypothetical protein
MELLSQPSANPKIAKNEKLGVLTAPLHLAPYDLSGYQVCPMASAGCAAACLNTAGRGGIIKAGDKTNRIQEARKRKTKLYFENRKEFMNLLVKDIKSMVRKANRENMICGIRLNATSDIPWERVPVEGHKNIMEMFPDVEFYDYTKRHNRKNLPKNYHLTYSLAEDNDDRATKAMLNGMNVAVVFRKELPKTFTLEDDKCKLKVRVINGDEHDYRPNDPHGVIVGLKAKGKARTDKTGFVRC